VASKIVDEQAEKSFGIPVLLKIFSGTAGAVVDWFNRAAPKPEQPPLPPVTVKCTQTNSGEAGNEGGSGTNSCPPNKN
jgi:hypothetical protein